MFEDTVKRESELEATEDELSLSSDRLAQEIRFINGRCSELPENPSYPLLVKLFLQDNLNLTDIPPSFFEHMPNLELLNLSDTSITTLPKSVSKLLKLQELFLKHCEMLTELPPEIGSLTNLRVLDLEHTELICLPKQIGCLLQLQCLKFSLYKYIDHHKEGAVISRQTLSKLSSLKELSIHVDPECEWWDVEVEAIIDDLGKLGNLKILKLYLPTPQLLKKLVNIFPALSNFQLIVGRHEDPIMSYVPRVLQEEFMKLDKCLKYVNLGDYLYEMEKELQHVRALFIHRHWRVRSLSEFHFTEVEHLKFCLLAECDSMLSIINGLDLSYTVGDCNLGSLSYLGIYYLKNLLSIWKGPSAKGYLSNLKILAIHTCPNLTTIFNHGFLEDLVFLEELVIKDCTVLKSLVDPDFTQQINTPLPSLRKISLLHLPKLENISSSQCIALNLETMVIYNCPGLENLHPLEKCSKNIKMIKGESKWWESKKSGWSSEHYDYLVSVFVPLKIDDDEDYDDDELAEAVHISLTNLSQASISADSSSSSSKTATLPLDNFVVEMGTDANEVVQRIPSYRAYKVHGVICAELERLVDKIDGIFPEIEAARPRCSSGLQTLCLLSNTKERAKSLLQYCSESSKLYMVLTGESILSRCMFLRNMFGQTLSQMQNMVPVLLAAEIYRIVSELREANFTLDPVEDEAGKAVKMLFKKSKSSAEFTTSIKYAAIRLGLTSRKYILLEKRSIRKLVEESGDNEPKQQRLQFLYHALTIYENSISKTQTENEFQISQYGSSIRTSRRNTLMTPTLPEEYKCPLSGRLMYDPVLIDSGQTFEKMWIRKWFDEEHDTCPITKCKLKNFSLMPNTVIKDLITKWCTLYGVAVSDPYTDGAHGWENCSTSVSNFSGSMNDHYLPVDLSNVSLNFSDSSLTRHDSDLLLKNLDDGLSWDSRCKIVEDFVCRLKQDEEYYYRKMTSANFVEPIFRFLIDAADLIDVQAQRTGCRLLLGFLKQCRDIQDVSYDV